jgi:uncharacterized protein (TIGR02145 family)
MILTFNSKILTAGTKWLEHERVIPPEVQIGNQIWKTSNLAIDDGQGGIKTATINLGNGDITEYYYTWDAANRIASSIEGWHLPSNEEFTTLANAIGSNPGTKLKSTYGWNNDGNGTDDYGFTGLPVGKYESLGGTINFVDVGARTYYWTSTQSQYSAGLMRHRDLYYAWGSLPEGSSATGAYWYSVRLVKD